MTKPS